MNTYTIPTFSLDELQKKINHIQNKGVNVFFKVGDPYKKKYFPTYKDERGNYYSPVGIAHYIDVVDVTVEGKYIINGWEFVATIEHTENGNIIRRAPGMENIEIPEKYKTIGPECEHCHIIRDRKDTYLIHNLDTNEFKQIGRTCLKQYTGGLDAETCTQAASLESYLQSLGEDKNYGENRNFTDSIKALDFKKYAYNEVKEHGYIKGGERNSTSNIVIDDMFKEDGERTLKPATDQELEEIDDWLKNKNLDNEYLQNASLAWNKEYLEDRDLNLIASLISVYFRDKTFINQNKASSTSEYVGTIGSKINVDIVSQRVLYTKYGSQYGYGAPDTYVYEIKDNKGNIYIWSTSLDLKDAKEIVATVKDQKEYKGIKQTILTRGKIIK